MLSTRGVPLMIIVISNIDNNLVPNSSILFHLTTNQPSHLSQPTQNTETMPIPDPILECNDLVPIHVGMELGSHCKVHENEGVFRSCREVRTLVIGFLYITPPLQRNTCLHSSNNEDTRHLTLVLSACIHLA
jgi:hypothetical protein